MTDTFIVAGTCDKWGARFSFGWKFTMSGLRELFSRFSLGVDMNTVGRTKQLLLFCPSLLGTSPTEDLCPLLEGG